MGVGGGIALFRVDDFFLVPIYFLVILLAAFFFRNIKYADSPFKKYFIPGLIVKLAGGIGVGLVYGFYYKGGDTFYYYYDAKGFYLAFQDSFGTFLRMLVLPANSITKETYDYTWWLTYFRDPAGWTTDKVMGVISIFSFYSYPVMALIVSALSFTGAWALYITFCDLKPHLFKPFAYCVLFVPSVFFWGSGVLKDSVTFGCLGWITYCSYHIFFRRKKVISNTLILVFSAYLLLSIKPYIILSFLPALFFWIFLTYRSRIRINFLRILLGPLLFIAAAYFGYLLTKEIGAAYQQFSLENVKTTADAFHSWHTYLAENEGSSGYSLGEIDMTSNLSIASKFPAAVAVTLFQPFLWKATNPVMLLSALESTVIMLFSIYLIIRNGILGTLRAIGKNPTVFFCFFFALFFAFAVGFTSYNFGALVRYKIPCIPFYLIGLVILNDMTREHGRDKKLRRIRKGFEPKAETIPLQGVP